MKFLIDACAASRLMVHTLTELGHDVITASDIDPRADDEYLLELAYQENRILITEDKDFGDLVFVRGLPHHCIIRFTQMPVSGRQR